MHCGPALGAMGSYLENRLPGESVFMPCGDAGAMDSGVQNGSIRRAGIKSAPFMRDCRDPRGGHGSSVPTGRGTGFIPVSPSFG